MTETNLGKMPILIVALVIGIIMATTAILPLASDYSEAKTFENKGYYDMTYTETDNITLFWDHTKPTEVTVNDEVIPLLAPTVGLARTIICGDDWIVRYSITNQGVLGVEYNSASGDLSANAQGTKDLTVVASDGTATITAGTGTRSATYTYLYCVAKDGPFVMKDSAEKAYINKDSTIYGMGVSFNVAGATSIYIRTSGSINDGLTSTPFIVKGTEQTITVTDVTPAYNAVNGYIDLYTIDNFVITLTDGTNTGTATYTYFIVPSEVTAEPDNPDTYKNLIKIVPLMAFIMLVVAAAAMIISKRD